MKQKKTPMRMCVACRAMKPKRDLLRVVRQADGSVSIDESGKQSGRGAYVCRSVDCVNMAQKTRALDRALEHKVAADVFDNIRGAIEG